jgi:DNA-binding MarR family transcriptional regulator
LSWGPQVERSQRLADLARELRQFQTLGASFSRAAAARVGLTVTDMQVIESLASMGPMTAGQLAELTGLTTGAITGMLNRLEEAGIVRRERDAEDGRRVIVRLSPDNERVRGIGPIFDPPGTAWEELIEGYDDDQIAFLVAFLRRANGLSEKELARLREAPRAAADRASAPLGEVVRGQLVVPAGASRLILRGDAEMADLYRASFGGALPEVKTAGGVVTIRYPRRRWLLGGGHGMAEITLNAAIPWQIVIQGGASDIAGELGNLDLTGLEVKGGMSMIRLELPAPSRVVPIRISGGVSAITMHRPRGVAARVHLKGWASEFAFDGQRFSNVGNDVRLHSPGYDGTTPGYDIEVASSASAVAITAG